MREVIVFQKVLFRGNGLKWRFENVDSLRVFPTMFSHFLYLKNDTFLFALLGPEAGQKRLTSLLGTKERLRIEILFFKMASSPVNSTNINDTKVN